MKRAEWERDLQVPLFGSSRADGDSSLDIGSKVTEEKMK